MTRAGREAIWCVVLIIFAAICTVVSCEYNYRVNKERFPSAPDWTHYHK